MNSSLTVKPDLDMARYHLGTVNDAMTDYWARNTSDLDGQMTDVRRAVESLAKAIQAVAQSVEGLAALPVCDGTL